MADKAREPIRIRCPGAGNLTVGGLCPYCGRGFGVGLLVPAHDCDDVIAMLRRGDYG